MAAARTVAVVLICTSGLFAGGVARAQSVHVRAGATGDGSGSDWVNACPDLDAAAGHPCNTRSLRRGAIYYVAVGSYGAHSFATPESGSETITIRSATEAEHGSDAGWRAEYEGQAVFGEMSFQHDHYVIDGVHRDELDWQNVASYGIRIAGAVYIGDTESAASQSDHLEFRYIDVGGEAGTIYPDPAPEVCFKPIGAADRPHTEILIHRIHCHNVVIPIHSRFTSGVTIEYVHFGPSWGKEVISHQYGDDWIVRHFVWRDNGIDGDEVLTAEIGVFNFTGGGSPDDVHADRWQVYSGVIHDTDTYSIHHADAVVLAGNVHGWRVYNLTLVNLGYNRDDILISGTDNAVHNILFASVGGYDDISSATVQAQATRSSHHYCQRHALPGRAGATCDRLAEDHPGTIASDLDPFEDLASLSYQLRPDLGASSPLDHGIALGEGFDPVDMRGVIRGADGAWDIGAFELGEPAACPGSPSCPSDAGRPEDAGPSAEIDGGATDGGAGERADGSPAERDAGRTSRDAGLDRVPTAGGCGCRATSLPPARAPIVLAAALAAAVISARRRSR